MSADKSCPVDLKTVDKNMVRSNAFFVFVIIMIYLLTGNPVLILIILIDFAIRVFPGVKYSPVSRIIKYLLRKASIKPQLIDAWPKIFAAKIGLMLAIIITVFHFTNFTIPSGKTLTASGLNYLSIKASGTATINGLINLSGTNGGNAVFSGGGGKKFHLTTKLTS